MRIWRSECYTHTHTYIYIVIHRQTVSLYQNSSVWLNRLDSSSWDSNLADWNANPRFYHTTMRKLAQAKEILTLMYHISFVYIYLLNDYQELNSFEEPCFTLVATITSLARELNPTGVGEHIYIYIYIYIYMHTHMYACIGRSLLAYTHIIIYEHILWAKNEKHTHIIYVRIV